MSDLQDRISKAMRQAWDLGQLYWQQADSDSYLQNSKADETYKKFEALVEEVRNAIGKDGWSGGGHYGN
jgi:hypothetical protein